MEEYNDVGLSDQSRERLISSQEKMQSMMAPVGEEELGGRAVVYIKEKKSKWSSFASFFAAFTLGVIAASMVFGLAIREGSRSKQTEELEVKTFAFAKTDPLPSVPVETVTFEEDPIYSAKSSDDSDFQWNMLLPQGRGYVFVPDSGERGLAPGQQTEYGPIYSVAMYHQLHCLARIRKMHWIFLDAVSTGEDTIARSQTGRTPSAHASHCFDYLRQSILCNGDMTLEWPKQDGPSSGVAVDGWGVPHTCKSPTAIKDYMDMYHYNSSMYFDAAG